MEPTQIRNILEACLLVAGRPMSIKQLAALFEDDIDKPAKSELREALTNLASEYEGRGIELVEVASGWRLQTRNTMEHWVSRLFEEKSPRYSRALLETLVLIAYRQPVTRGEIEEVRGVAVSSNIIRTLQERQWIREVGHKDVPGKPALFGTTREFLDYFNLKQLEDLPPLGKVMDMEQVEAVLAAEIGLVEGASDSVAANDESGEESGEENQTGQADSTSTESAAGDEVTAAQSPETSELEAVEGDPAEGVSMEAESVDAESAESDSVEAEGAGKVSSAGNSPVDQGLQEHNNEDGDGDEGSGGSESPSLSLVEAQTDPGGEVVLLRPLTANSNQIDAQNLPDDQELEPESAEPFDSLNAEESSLHGAEHAQSSERDASNSFAYDDIEPGEKLEAAPESTSPREPEEISSKDILAQAIKSVEGKDQPSLSDIADGFERSREQGAEQTEAAASLSENEIGEQETALDQEPELSQEADLDQVAALGQEANTDQDASPEDSDIDTDGSDTEAAESEPEQDARSRLKQVIDNFAGEHQQEIDARDEFETRKLSGRPESDSGSFPNRDSGSQGGSDQSDGGSMNSSGAVGGSTNEEGNEPEMVLEAQESFSSHAMPPARETSLSSSRPPFLRLVRNEIPASVSIEELQGLDPLTSLDVQETESFATDAGQSPESLAVEDEPVPMDELSKDELNKDELNKDELQPPLDDQQAEAELSALAELIDVPASVVREQQQEPDTETEQHAVVEPDSEPGAESSAESSAEFKPDMETGGEPIADDDEAIGELTNGERSDDNATPAPDT